MKIRIRPHEEALALVQEKPHQLDVVFITSPRSPFQVEGSEAILELARSSIMVQFDDVDGPEEGKVPPRREDVSAVLEWAADKTELLVSCQAGVSRSAAMAVVILASRGPIRDALRVLSRIHYPNQLVIGHGEEILGKTGLSDAVRDWKRQSLKR